MDTAEARPYYEKFQTWAVLGVSPDPERFSYQVYTMLKRNSKTVYGISPKNTELEGDKLFRSLREIPPVEVVVFMVNPAIGIEELDVVKELGIKNIWLQPGSFDDAFVEKAKSLGLFMVDKCVLIVAGEH